MPTSWAAASVRGSPKRGDEVMTQRVCDSRSQVDGLGTRCIKMYSQNRRHCTWSYPVVLDVHSSNLEEKVHSEPSLLRNAACCCRREGLGFMSSR